MQTNRKCGILTVISGFSGSGKGTVIKHLLAEHAEYCLSVSATTRAPRPGEEHGREYFFFSKEEFLEMLDRGEFLEHAQYVDNYYGTPLPFVRQKLEEGCDVILEIEMQGAKQVKARFPEAVLIFITPPSLTELERRLRGRGTESEEVIRGRLTQAAKESRAMQDYDYILVNETDRAMECADTLHDIMRSEHLAAFRCSDFIEDIALEAERFLVP